MTVTSTIPCRIILSAVFWCINRRVTRKKSYGRIWEFPTPEFIPQRYIDLNLDDPNAGIGAVFVGTNRQATIVGDDYDVSPTGVFAQFTHLMKAAT